MRKLNWGKLFVYLGCLAFCGVAWYYIIKAILWVL